MIHNQTWPFVSEYRSLMIFSILPSIPKEFSLAISPFLQIVSKAFEKSTKEVYEFFIFMELFIN